MLVQEVLSRNMRDRRAIARYAGLTASYIEEEKRPGGMLLAPASKPQTFVAPQ
jgi:hypothetical protein